MTEAELQARGTELAQGLTALAGAFERTPSELATIQRLVTPKVEKRVREKREQERPTSRDLARDVVREVLPDAARDVERDPDARKALERMHADFAGAWGVVEARDEQQAIQVGLVLFLGFGLGGVVVGTACLLIWALN